MVVEVGSSQGGEAMGFTSEAGRQTQDLPQVWHKNISAFAPKGP